MAILAVDAGAGTQDILLWNEGAAPESSVKMVMPRMTVIVGRRISSATARKDDVFLTGTTMGGDMMMAGCLGLVDAARALMEG